MRFLSKCKVLSASLLIMGSQSVFAQTLPLSSPTVSPRPVVAPGDPIEFIQPVEAAPEEIVTRSVAPALLNMAAIRPPARDGNVPRTRWEHRGDHTLWNRAALSALKSHGGPLTDMVPADIENWCPRYADQDVEGRRKFWVGFMSSLAKHESTYRPTAVGGGGLWYGLLQILPATARGYGCMAKTGEELKNGSANLSCAVRIMAVTVPRDGVVHGKDRKYRGVSADWGPMTNEGKRRDIARWLRRQPYCASLNAVRPRVAPIRTLQLEARGDGDPRVSFY